MKIEVGQEYIDKHGTVYKIDIIGHDGTIGYSIADGDGRAYYHAGSAYIDTILNLIRVSDLIPFNKTAKVLYGKG